MVLQRILRSAHDGRVVHLIRRFFDLQTAEKVLDVRLPVFEVLQATTSLSWFLYVTPGAAHLSVPERP
jgi:hypothetical protein